MKNANIFAFSLLSTFVFSEAVHADISANVTLATDYRYRGISQSNEQVAVQGGFDWFHESGAYIGTWASNVDFFPTDSAFDDGASVEFDVWAGYTGGVGEKLTYDATLYYYQYPGDDIDQNFAEIGLGLNYEGFRLAYWYADSYLNLEKNNQYVEINYTADLPHNVVFKIHAGASFGEVYDDPMTLSLDEYADYSLGFLKNIGGVDVEIAYLDTTIDGNYEVSSGHLANQDTLLLSVSKYF